MNGYNFSERVRRMLAVARDESCRLHHAYVGTEHMLLGLLREEDGVAVAALDNLGIDRKAVEQKVARVVKPGGGGQDTGPDLPYTSRAKKVLELSMAEARDLNHTYVGTEHLLLGLLREERGIAAQVLVESGATVAKVRAEVLRILGDDAATAAPPHIASINMEVTYDNGFVVRETFPSVPEAMYFLYRMDAKERR